MRSSIVSIWPNIIVAVDRPPSSCQTRLTFSQSSVITLPRVIADANAIDQDLGPAAGQAAQPRRLEPLEHLSQRQLRHLREMVDLRRTEPVHVDPREVALDVVEQLFIPLELQMRMQPALHQDLVAAQRDRLADLLEQDVAVEHIRLGVVDLAVKRAEVADGRADVGVIDVPVDVERAERLGMEPPADLIGGPAQLQERRRTITARPLRRSSGAGRQRRGARSRRRWKPRLTPSGARPSAAAIAANRVSPAISGSPRS